MDIYISAYKHLTKTPTQSDYTLHAHNDYEIFYFLSGNAEYSVEGNKYHLSPGDIMIMRKNEFHYLILKSNTPYERIVVNFDLPDEFANSGLLDAFNNRRAGEKNLYRTTNIQYNHMLYYLRKICETNDSDRQFCYLLPFLDELKEAFSSNFDSEAPTIDRATHIINYINEHLEENISLSSVSEHFFLSQNHLNRLFKENTGTTLWEYVTVKRLFKAREKINAGEKPTKACISAGFKDYATFFRSYKKHFGTSPKLDKPKT